MNILKKTSKVYSKGISSYLKKGLSLFIKSLILSFTLLLSFGTQSAYAQQNSTESLELRVVTLEQQFDAQILDILSNYFDSRKFFVDVNIEAQFVDETYRSTENQIIRGNQSQEETVMMPGLPFLPEGNQRRKEAQANTDETTQTIINEQTIQRLQILGLRVNVFADSSFTSQEVEFMRLIAGIAGKINESRGDVVNVSLINMPDFGIDALPPAKVQTNDETLLGSVKDYIPGFVLLLLVGLTLLVGRLTHSPSSKKKNKEQTSKRDDLRKEKPADFSNFDDVKTKRSHIETIDQRPSGSKLSFITDQFLNNSKEVALLFEFWMEEDHKTGVKKAAKVVQSIDKHLLKALKRHLSKDSFNAIQQELEVVGSLTFHEKQNVADDFKEALDQGLRSSGNRVNHQQLGLFQFLDHLEEHHILQLLYGEDRDTSALLIDYLPDNKAANVLARVDKERSKDIMIGMANLHKLSYSSHKNTSSRLFSKAMDILEVDREIKQGSKNILRVLEQLPLEDQQEYIDQLKSTGSPVADVIINTFVTVDQIPTLSDHIIKDALASITTETLVEALASFNDTITQKLLSVRPKREQRLIKMELQQMDQEDPNRINHAKLHVVNTIRNTVQTNSF